MVFPKKLWWKIYFFLLAPFLVVGLLNLFNPQSPQYVYYNALIAFHENYTLAYFLAVAGAAINLASLLPLGLFILRIRLFKGLFWKGFFFLKILLEIFGHHFELNFLKSLPYTNLWHILLTVATIFVIFFPSYLACFLYAFRREIIPAEPNKT